MTDAPQPPSTPPEDELVARARAVATAWHILWPIIGPLMGLALVAVAALVPSIPSRAELVTAAVGLLSGSSLLAVVKAATGKKG